MAMPGQPPRHAQRGAAALVVVMMLFFIVSLVAAYASRNLIFEQRTSANNYRATQAFDAAEAGLEWTIAMLNGGRIDASCASTADTTRTSFRERYLEAEADGSLKLLPWSDAGTDKPFFPSCVRDGGGMSCSCPIAGNPVLAAPAGSGAATSFRISFEAVGGQPGLVRVFSRGCSGFGGPCYPDAATGVDANAEVSALLGLAPSLTQTPVAAFTVRGPAPFDPGGARFVGGGAGGLAINAGGPIDPAPVVSGPAGTPIDPASGGLVVPLDTSLSDLPVSGGLSPGEMMFLATFGMPPAAFRVQPAVVRLSCVDDCATVVQLAADAHPGRVLWIDGDLTIPSAATLNLGSSAAPAMLVVTGDLDFAVDSIVDIHGLVYSRGTGWTADGTATVTGAFVAEGAASADPTIDGGFTIVGAPTLVFDQAAVERLAQVRARQVLDFGSFVRVPGSWRDFR